MRRFDYYRAISVDEAIALLNEHGEGGMLLSGGTDLLVQIKEAGLAPAYVVGLSGIDELRELRSNGDGLHIGAGVLMHEVASDGTVQAQYSALCDGAGVVGSRQTRNMATVGGNVCNAAPSADTGPPLSVLDATVHVAGGGGTREVAIDDFWTGPGRTVLDSEVVTHITVPAPPANAGSFYERHTPRQIMDIAAVAAVATPSLLHVGAEAGLSPLGSAMSVAMATTVAFLPYQAAPFMVALGFGTLRVRDLSLAMLLISTLSILILCPLCILYWRVLGLI